MARKLGSTAGFAAAMVLVLVVASTMEASTMAAAQGLCKMTQDGLTACKPSISSVKPVDKPTDACCSALKGADLPCLCAYKNSNLLPYLGIDPTLAMQLPAKCNIPAPAQC